MFLVLVVNVTASVGAFAFGSLQDRIGHIPTIALTLCGWILMVLLAWMAESRSMFWVAANIAGLCLGASQSAGRALVGYFQPKLEAGGIFWIMGLGGQAVVNTGTGHLWRGELDFKRRSPAGDADHRRLFCYWPSDIDEHRCKEGEGGGAAIRRGTRKRSLTGLNEGWRPVGLPAVQIVTLPSCF